MKSPWGATEGTLTTPSGSFRVDTTDWVIIALFTKLLRLGQQPIQAFDMVAQADWRFSVPVCEPYEQCQLTVSVAAKSRINSSQNFFRSRPVLLFPLGQ